MAMICKNGCKECDGCMMCYPEDEPYICTICGKECETIYLDKYDEIVGCDICIKTKEYWEMDND